MNKFSNSLGPTSVRTNNLRQLIRKCPALTLAVQTSPTARLHLHHHGGALSRQVLKVSEISAVPTCRRLAAPRTGAYFRSDCRDHPTIAVPLDRKNPRAWPGSPIHVFSHTRLSARRPIKPTSTESEADPVILRPGWGWFLDSSPPAASRSFWASVSAGTNICASFWCMERGRRCPMSPSATLHLAGGPRGSRAAPIAISLLWRSPTSWLELPGRFCAAARLLPREG